MNVAPAMLEELSRLLSPHAATPVNAKLSARCRQGIVEEITRLLAMLDACERDKTPEAQELMTAIKTKLRSLAGPLWDDGPAEE